MGFSLLILVFFGLSAGFLRNELILILLGAVFLAVSLYCFIAVLFTALLHRRCIPSLSVRISPTKLSSGQEGTILCFRDRAGIPEKGSDRTRHFFRLPGALVRYLLELRTRDGRYMNQCFDPDRLKDRQRSFQVGERGAYYGNYDQFCVFDALGLFRIHFRLAREAGPRLLVLPEAAEESIFVTVHSGGQEQRIEPRFQRTDNLIDHRPYVPGDDPRKINWKLYSHAGDLFVRNGEPEPPPHSRLVILMDTYTDSVLYTPEAGRQAVDVLCSQVLALAQEYADQGIETLIGYTGSTDVPGIEGKGPGKTGGEIPVILQDTGESGQQPFREKALYGGGLWGGTPGELAAVLACPAALSPAFSGKDASVETAPAGDMSTMTDLPAVPDDRNILILALPRIGDNSEGGRPLPGAGTHRPPAPAAPGALDRFLKTRNKQAIDLLFLYAGEGLDAAAEENVLFYNRKGGVHARRIRL
ncbi:MAG: DUF58 domain-containing protein [Spirochaetaceae bacterium]|jgi:hypothetical protein|nr:DUF58 domain-containing protein [Spirochaetaceae bacterium]